jgi:hydroxymethylbilane synthase
MTPTLTIGSRGSQLALWQARHIQSRLAGLGVESRIEIIRTTGDKITDVPLAKVGGKGLFTKEIEEALLDGRIDLAVHSLKDLPTELPAGLTLAAIPEREDTADALIGARLDDLPPGACVGTSSLRRAAQLRALRPDLVIENIRGNLDTRLRKLDEGQYHAILLAAAGLRRLGWAERITELLTPERMVPAVGQGALAIETRAEGPARALCQPLDHGPTRAAVTAERALLAALGGGCQVPIGAHAVLEDDGLLHLTAIVAHPDGHTLLRHQDSAPPAEAAALGQRTAARLLDSGARVILHQVYGDAPPLTGLRILNPRAAEQATPLSQKLRTLGAEVVELPAIELVPLDFDPIDSGAFDWIVFTSANAVRFFWRSTPAAPPPAKLCAIGPATAAALSAFGLTVHLVADQHHAEGVAAALGREDLAGKHILLPAALATRDVLPRELSALGALVTTLPVYRNVVPAGLEPAAQALFAEGARPHWVLFTSPSTVKNLLAAAGREAFEGVRIAALGPITTDTARRHGLAVDVEANPSTTEALVESLRQFILG